MILCRLLEQHRFVRGAIHAPCQIFEVMGTDGVLLVDADHTFNSLNRAVAVRNIQYTCPLLTTTIINFYRAPAVSL